MRPLVMDFQNDAAAVQQKYEYMFGKEMLIAPVTEAGVTDWSVYLPKTSKWYDLWTGKPFAGGQTVKADAGQGKIPVFVKGGSIIPFGKEMQYTGQVSADELEIRVYKGANCRFELYEDEGDSYNYEKGKYTLVPFIWNEAAKTLTIGKREGAYAGNLKARKFNIVLVKDGLGIGKEDIGRKTITYTGKSTVIKVE